MKMHFVTAQILLLLIITVDWSQISSSAPLQPYLNVVLMLHYAMFLKAYLKHGKVNSYNLSRPILLRLA